MLSPILFMAVMSPAMAAVLELKQGDQDNLSMMVYQGNLAEISATRRAGLETDTDSLRWSDLPAAIDYDSFEISAQDKVFTDIRRSLKPRMYPTILEQFVGQEITWIQDTRTGMLERKATLLEMTPNGPLLKFSSGVELNPGGYPRFQTIPDTSHENKISLEAGLMKTDAGSALVTAHYQTSQIDWSAHHKAVLNADMDKLTLNSRVSISNQTSRDYMVDQLTLVAGDTGVQKKYPVMQPMMRSGTMADMEAKAAMVPVVEPSVAQADRYLFPIKGMRDIPAASAVKFNLFDPVTVPVETRYELDWRMPWGALPANQVAESRPDTVIRFVNSEANGLGMALPEGTIRIYSKAAEAGPDILLKEDSMNNTAKGQEVAFSLGKSFDITAKHIQKDFDYISTDRRDFETTYEIILTNAKDKAVQVQLNDYLPAAAEILDSNADYEKTSATSLTWNVEVPANGEHVLTYKVRVKN